jgi:Tol biopolymer transport system component
MLTVMIGTRVTRSPSLVLGLAVAAVVAGFAVASRAVADPSPGEPREGLYVFSPTSAAPRLVIAGEEDDPTWSPDGRWISAVETNDYYLNVVAPRGGSRHRVDSLSWSNDGSRVAYTSRGTGAGLFIGPSDWSTAKLVIPKSVAAVGWAPDDSAFAYANRASGGSSWASLVVVDANGTRPRTVFTHSPVNVSWSPTGRLLAVMAFDTHVYVVPSTGGAVRRLRGAYESWPSPEWSPDDGALFIYPTKGVSSSSGGFDATKLSLSGGPTEIVCRNCPDFSFSPNHQAIAFVDASAALWVENADGTNKRHIVDGVQPFAYLDWSRDSSRLVVPLSGAGRHTALALVDAATGQVRRLTDGRHFDRTRGDPISSDGRFVAFDRASESTGHQLWIVGSDGTGARKVIAFGTCSLMTWAPKGALLAITNLDDC